MSSVNNVTHGAGADTGGGAATDAATSQLSKDTFLKLLVAQIRYQNPLNPADGVEFLSQLAQFTELEQMMGMHSEVQSLREEIAGELEHLAGMREDLAALRDAVAPENSR